VRHGSECRLQGFRSGRDFLFHHHASRFIQYAVLRLALGGNDLFCEQAHESLLSGRLQESETFGSGSSYRFAGRSARLIAALMLSRLGNQKTEDTTEDGLV
jgi:hypothetical protein